MTIKLPQLAGLSVDEMTAKVTPAEAQIGRAHV